MIYDARKLSDRQTFTCDVCIVGAGAAGISVAMELAQTDKRIILLEAGGMNRSGKSQTLYRGHLSDPNRHLPLESDRYRQLGGTTAVWGGRCIPFDPIDFQKRPYVPHSGWPLTRPELDPFYQRAHDYCECGKFYYNSDVALPQAPPEMITGFIDGDVISSGIERWSPPTHFGKRYRKALKHFSNLHVYLNAICTRIDLTSDGLTAHKLKVRTFGRNTIYILPKIVVLCGGGLEVTRLLLASNGVFNNGIGSHSGWLGKGYMCHINGIIARAKFTKEIKVIFGYEIDPEGVYCRRRLLLSEKAQRNNELLNIHFLLDRPLIENPSHNSGTLSFAYLVKKLGQPHFSNKPSKGKYSLYWKHLRNILNGSPELFTVLPKWFRDRFVQGRRIPSLLVGNRSNTYHLYYHTEQIPDKNSHIRLAADRDALGVPRLIVDYQITDKDVDSIYRAHQLVDQAFRGNSVGHLIYLSDDPKESIREHQATLGHHIGTTRMSANPSNGVVDENCKMHHVSNLYIASSSVFPTSSQANPTLTIVAMAIRLADFLKQTQINILP